MWQLEDAIQKEHKDKGKTQACIVKFEPWRHDKDEALWAAFVLTFLDQIRGRWYELRRWTGDWKLFWLRFQWDKGWIDVVRCVVFWFAFTMICVVVVWVSWTRGLGWASNFCEEVLGVVAETQGAEDSTKPTFLVWLLGRGSFAAVIGGLISLWHMVAKMTGNPLKVNLKKYLKHPQYADRVSFIDRLHSDFRKIVSAYAGQERTYVFIDDLDRCAVPKAAELMESINLMISEEPNLVFVMGMDREKVAAGLAVKHEKLLPYLSGRVGYDGQDTDEAKRVRGVRYGYSFIEKFIQVPFVLPQPGRDEIEVMLLEMARQQKKGTKPMPGRKEPVRSTEDPESKSLVSMVPDPEVGDLSVEVSQEKVKKTATKVVPETERKAPEVRKYEIEGVLMKFHGDDENVREVVLIASEAFDYNPRKVKQFVNVFRLRAATAIATGLFDGETGAALTLEQLGKFAGLGLGWPLLIRDLAEEPELLDQLVEVAVGEKEGKDLQKRYHQWAAHEGLLRFIKAGCFDDNGKKKDAEEFAKFSLKGVDVRKLLQVAPAVKESVEVMLE